MTVKYQYTSDRILRLFILNLEITTNIENNSAIIINDSVTSVVTHNNVSDSKKGQNILVQPAEIAENMS